MKNQVNYLILLIFITNASISYGAIGETYSATDSSSVHLEMTTTPIPVESQNISKQLEQELLPQTHASKPLRSKKKGVKTQISKKKKFTLTQKKPTPKRHQVSPTIHKNTPIYRDLAPKRYQFDVVPLQHVDSIVVRLEWVKKLLKKHGRAYDYRIHKLSELKKIYHDLEQQNLPLPPDPLKVSKR
ncbi:MAG: hypothetical protein CL678_00105 [Bdellovibrionaceae bacterium]|nr:hypothetical protein [Pseudobdellovibrionaceae bacterium]|tara:strand:- start:5011 stop:5568 length:558 start_codon:yes stop_codon:yes gene_type:complete